MEVSVSVLRAELKSWIERARTGEEVVITDRGIPVARLTGVATAGLVEELERDGLLAAPNGPRPVIANEEPRQGARPALGVAGLVRRIRR